MAEEKNLDQGKKSVPLRLSRALWEEIAAWAADDFRSINGQIEYLLTQSVRKRRRGSKLESAMEESEERG